LGDDLERDVSNERKSQARNCHSQRVDCSASVIQSGVCDRHDASRNDGVLDDSGLNFPHVDIGLTRDVSKAEGDLGQDWGLKADFRERVANEVGDIAGASRLHGGRSKE
jgi:hypothetical protein